MLLTPTYHVFKMYVPFTTPPSCRSTWQWGRTSRVTSIAACGRHRRRDAAGKLWLSLTNLDPNLAVSIDVVSRHQGHEGAGAPRSRRRKSTA